MVLSIKKTPYITPTAYISSIADFFSSVRRRRFDFLNQAIFVISYFF